MVPDIRIHPTTGRAPNPAGSYVLYWMTSARRTRYNAALERAVHWANQLNKPLLVLEALRLDYPWASQRLHRFVLEGMVDNQAAFRAAGAAYYPYVEQALGDGKGLLSCLSESAAVVVTDHFPTFFLPRMTSAAAQRCNTRFEIVDGNGVLPLALPGKAYPTAYAFRRWMQKHVLQALHERVVQAPLADLRIKTQLSSEAEPLGNCGVAEHILKRWSPTPLADNHDVARLLDSLPLSTAVSPVNTRGGQVAGDECIGRFLTERLDGYGEQRNDPCAEVTSSLSPYLHFGHVSSVDVVNRILQQHDDQLDEAQRRYKGQRHGFWGRPEHVEGFLDQIITWRELGYGFCHHRPEYAQYDSLPPWALETLKTHAVDDRPYVYDLDEFEQAKTHDPIWNAAQTQLTETGHMHNYLRMLWGKKILHWSKSPREALDTMVELNNRFALDGRNPNSYSGIFWVMGRFDRPWGPERPIFGKVRYMTSASTARKFKLGAYLSRYGQTLV